MRKNKIVEVLHKILAGAGYSVSRRAISEAFKTRRGKYSRQLYGVWQHADVSTILGALRNRGVVPQKKEMIAPTMSASAGKPMSPRPWGRNLCPECGYADPQWRQASRCPSCEAERQI